MDERVSDNEVEDEEIEGGEVDLEDEKNETDV